MASTRNETCEMLVYMLEKSYGSCVVILCVIAENANQHVCFSTKNLKTHASTCTCTVHVCVNFDMGCTVLLGYHIIHSFAGI